MISKDASSDSVLLSRVGCFCALTGSMPRSASVHSLILLPSMCSCFPPLRGSFSSSTLGSSPPLKRGSGGGDGGGSAARTHHPLARSLARSCVLCPSLLPSPPPSPLRSLLPSWPTEPRAEAGHDEKRGEKRRWRLRGCDAAAAAAAARRRGMVRRRAWQGLLLCVLAFRAHARLCVRLSREPEVHAITVASLLAHISGERRQTCEAERDVYSLVLFTALHFSFSRVCAREKAHCCLFLPSFFLLWIFLDRDGKWKINSILKRKKKEKKGKQHQGCQFNSWPLPFLCGVCMSSLYLREFLTFFFHSPKACVLL